jgi:hypothetical protein
LLSSRPAYSNQLQAAFTEAARRRHQEKLLRSNLFGEISLELTLLQFAGARTKKCDAVAVPSWRRSDLMGMRGGVVKCSGSHGVIQTIVNFFQSESATIC